MSDSRVMPRHDGIPVLPHVASPSPAKARRRQATERPALSTTDVGALKLPSELFAIATSRASQGDMALSKALDGIQAAATRLETERAKLVIQSQELQIWDMAREEELVLLRAENEQLEQQLATFGEKISKGLGRDGVLESLQFALRKARYERDVEVREADGLFNQLQEAKAAAEELRELRAAFVSALSSLRDDWSTIPLISEDARELRARVDAAVKDPTNLSQQEITTLLRGLLVLASRGLELQSDVQALRGEKAALQQALDAAQQELADQAEQLQQLARPGASSSRSPGRPFHAPSAGEPSPAITEGSRRGALLWEDELEQQRRHGEVVHLLQRQVSELEGKVAEYRSYLADNQEEIESLQNEVKRLREGQRSTSVQAVDATAVIQFGPHATQASKRPPPAHQPAGTSARTMLFAPGSAASGASGAISSLFGAVSTGGDALQRRQAKPHPEPSGLQVAGTPTRHVPSSSSPISTINYGASPPPACSPSARSSPGPHTQPVADIAQKVVELQELALRAQQQAVDREAEIFQQHEQALAALRDELSRQKAEEQAALAAQLSQQHEQALAEAQAREADLAAQHARDLAIAQERATELSHQHTRALEELQAEMASVAEQHAQAEAELRAQLERLSEEHSRDIASREERAAQHLREQLRGLEADLQRLHRQALEQQAAEANEAMSQALADQAARIAQEHAEALRKLEAQLEQQFSERERELEKRTALEYGQRARELEEKLQQQYAERQARREEDMRQKHAERLAEQAAQLAQMHAEQAAALGVQHAEQLSDMEAQAQQRLEQSLGEQEVRLAAAHAERLREAESQVSARVRAAVEKRATELEELHAEALRRQAGALAGEAEARVQRLLESHTAELASLAEQHKEDLRQLEGELAGRLEDSRVRVQELERELEEARAANAAQRAEAEMATSDAKEAHALRRQVQELDEELAGQREFAEQLQQQCEEAQAALELGEQKRAEAVMAVERQCVEVVAKLGREHEQATAEARAVHELREANLRRQLERQAQEAAELQKRQGARLREMQDRVAELQALLKKERQQQATTSDALETLVEQLAADLGSARGEALQRASGSPARESPTPGARSRTPDADRRFSSSWNASLSQASVAPPQHRSFDGLDGRPELLPSESPERSVASSREPSHAEGPGGSGLDTPSSGLVALAARAAGPDAWHDGQALMWPQEQAACSSSSSSSSSVEPAQDASNVGSGLTHAPGEPGPPSSERNREVASAVGQLPPPLVPTSGAMRGRSSDQDFAANLVRALRGDTDSEDPGATGPVGSRVWSSSPELHDKKAPRRGLLQSLEASTASLPPCPQLEFEDGAVWPTSAGAVQTGSQQPAVGEDDGKEVVTAPRRMQAASIAVTRAPEASSRPAPSLPPLAPPPQSASLSRAADSDSGPPALTPVNSVAAALTPANSAAVTRVTFRNDQPSTSLSTPPSSATAEEDAWGELVGAHTPPPAKDDGAGADDLLDGAYPSGGPDPAYMSGAATSVSTTSSYNSDTEFYVDDEDDEDLRGRALAAALAQSPRTSQSAVFPLPPPPAVLEIVRRRSQSPGPSSPSGATTESPTRSGSDATSVPALDSPGSVVSGRPQAAAAGVGEREADGSGGAASDPSMRPSTSVGRPQAEDSGLQSRFRGRPRMVDLLLGEMPAGVGYRKVDLEATFTGPFPVLFPPLEHTRAEAQPSAPVGDAGSAPSALPPATAPAAQPHALLHTSSFAFSRPNPVHVSRFRTSGSGDEEVSSSGSGSGEESEAGSRGRDNPRDADGNQLRMPDPSDSFDFSTGGRLWAGAGEAATADAPFANGTARGELDLWRGGSADRGAGGGSGDLGYPTLESSAADGRRRTEELGEGADGGAGSISFESSSSSASMSPLSSPSTAYAGPGTAGYPTGRHPESSPAAPSVSPLSVSSGAGTPLGNRPGFWSSGPGYSPGDSVSASGGGDSEASGSARGGPSPRSVRLAPKGVVPLMAPNPLYSDTGEPSPPWSTADWETPRESATGLDGELFLPSIPGNDCSTGTTGNSVRGNPVAAAGDTADSFDAAGVVHRDAGGWEGSAAGSGEGLSVNVPDLISWSEAQESSGGLRGGGTAPTPHASGNAAESSGPAHRLVCQDGGQNGVGTSGDPPGSAPTGDAVDADEDGDDDARSLLAAGATLGSSERRRRQRRRMGDAISPVGHPVDLLRQSWQIAGGVATPLSPSPRSPRPHGLRLPPIESRSELAQSPSPQQPQQPQQDMSMLPLRTLAQVMESLGPISPRAGRSPRANVTLDASLPPPRAQPATTSRASSACHTPASPAASVVATGATETVTTPAGASSPPVAETAAIVPVDRPSGSLALVHAGQDARGEGEIGPLSMVFSPSSTASTPVTALNARAARQRSRELLGRVMSRVAELEGQCRALAAALPAAADGSVVSVGVEGDMMVGTDGLASAAPAGTPALLPYSAAHDASGGEGRRDLAAQLAATTPALRTGEPTDLFASPGPTAPAAAGSPSASPVPALAGPGDGTSPIASPAVAAEVMGALEDLRGDLHELEQLHLFTTRSGVTPLLDAAGPAVPVLEGRAEWDGGEALQRLRLLLPPPSAPHADEGPSTGGVSGEAPADAVECRPGTSCAPPAASMAAVQDSQAADSNITRSTSAAFATPDSSLGAGSRADMVNLFSPSGPFTTTPPSASTNPRGYGPAGPEPAAPLPAASPDEPFAMSGGGSSLSGGGGGPLLSNLDPVLVRLLQTSIQSQLQGQLGQMEAKIAELQRQNEALLAATAASTPATPLPTELLARGSAAGGPSWTPVPMQQLGPQGGNAGSGGGIGDWESGTPFHAGGGGGWLGRAAAASAAAAAVHAGAGSGPAVTVGMDSSATTQSTVKVPGVASGLEALAADALEPGHVSMSVYPGSVVALPRVVSPGQAASGVGAGDGVAGPYSPEQLSQLPPTIQLFAPPQLRAAALAAAHEQQQQHRRVA